MSMADVLLALKSLLRQMQSFHAILLANPAL